MPREDRITFDEESHVYTVDGVRVPRSVTGFLHSFSHEFDPREAIRSMQSGRNWEERRAEFTRDDGKDMTPDEIAARWASNGQVQRTRGTLLHYHAEQACNGRQIEEPHSPEFRQVLELLEAVKLRFEIYRTEFSMFNSALSLAGQADLLCRDGNGHFVVVDWKRCRQIRYDSRDPMLPPLEHLPDCNWSLYCLQLNMYAYFLESEYELAVSRMLLAVVHPLSARGALIEVPRLYEEIRGLVEHETAHCVYGQVVYASSRPPSLDDEQLSRLLLKRLRERRDEEVEHVRGRGEESSRLYARGGEGHRRSERRDRGRAAGERQGEAPDTGVVSGAEGSGAGGAAEDDLRAHDSREREAGVKHDPRGTGPTAERRVGELNVPRN